MDAHSIRMADGTRSVASFFAADQTSPLVICLPAMGVRAAFYQPVAEALQQRGLNVLTADLRGLGTSSVQVQRGVDFGYHEMLSYDWPAVVQTARRLRPASRLYLMGHSLGGQLSALYLSLEPRAADGLILVASCSVHYTGWPFPRNLGILAGTGLACCLASGLGYFPGHRLGFGGMAARTVIRDWARNAWTGDYRLAHSSIDFEKRLAHMPKPVLALAFKGDGFAPLAAVRNLCRKMPRAPQRLVELNRTATNGRGLDHFGWVKHAAPVVDCICDWIASRSAAAGGRIFSPRL